jgi:hypothetical protein
MKEIRGSHVRRHLLWVWMRSPADRCQFNLTILPPSALDGRWCYCRRSFIHRIHIPLQPKQPKLHCFLRPDRPTPLPLYQIHPCIECFMRSLLRQPFRLELRVRRHRRFEPSHTTKNDEQMLERFGDQLNVRRLRAGLWGNGGWKDAVEGGAAFRGADRNIVAGGNIWTGDVDVGERGCTADLVAPVVAFLLAGS